MPESESIAISVKILGDKAIVRKLRISSKGRVIERHALTNTGKWHALKEGEQYPANCWLRFVKEIEHYG